MVFLSFKTSAGNRILLQSFLSAAIKILAFLLSVIARYCGDFFPEFILTFCRAVFGLYDHFLLIQRMYGIRAFGDKKVNT